MVALLGLGSGTVPWYRLRDEAEGCGRGGDGEVKTTGHASLAHFGHEREELFPIGAVQSGRRRLDAPCDSLQE
jgi:hypothetical protein